MASTIKHIIGRNLFTSFRAPLIQSGQKFSTKSGTSKNFNFKKYALPILVCGTGIGILYSKRYQINLAILFPKLQAAQIFNRGDSEEISQKGYNSRNFNFIADVVDKASPAVVYIEVLSRVGFTQFAMSNGSGFVIEPNGLILTNAHVVGNSSEVKVQFKDGKVYNGTVESIDRYSDLATVRIKASGLPVLPLGKSSKVRPGEWVVALGSPLTLSNTITAGVVSSIRPSSDLGFPSKDMDFIQTDAAITFGNSGGPLVNLDGEAIGINSMKVTAGISFAIPSDYAVKFLERCQKKASQSWFGKSSSKGSKYIGITMLTLTPSFVKTMIERNPDFPHVKEGVYIWRLIKDSPAYKGGLLPGDVITHINKKPIQNALQVTDAIENYNRIEVTVQRQNEILSFIITPSS